MTQQILDEKCELRLAARKLEFEGRFLAAEVLWILYRSLPA